MPLLIFILFLIPSVTFAQSGSSTDIGTTTFYSFDTVNGSKHSIGKTEFYDCRLLFVRWVLLDLGIRSEAFGRTLYQRSHNNCPLGLPAFHSR